ncbi:unnamed protein product [Didymodactylos carnosus]|uniref:Uncharacterized protein n=1 Tax=Didymodactylos carnosus TaxID=1234261 RepID=A0A8S2VFU8_9BILA|nr:unnamed protein product [Didymodactylos carnosus]CAF4394376.1 unnamed protein product [Didymodactylos carnosus]
MKKPHYHCGDENIFKVEAFKMNLKRRSEESSQPVKRIYREKLISLHTTAPRLIVFTIMLHDLKNSFYKTRNDN